MSRRKQTNQLSLFTPGLDTDPTVKAAMREAARVCGLSREQICDRMNELASQAGIRLNGGNAKGLALPTLEKWLNPLDREHIPSARAIGVFCRAVGRVEPLQALVAPHGLQLINEEQARKLRMAEIEEEMEALKRERQRLKAGS
ncbi:hypothetical protein V6C53_08090 [Desulfocurvibacter africanus]|uniref:hypothetical protein n=1 Tax=Desulfocurvibacter africanus TaxID=873 RepID=UPI002FDA29FA